MTTHIWVKYDGETEWEPHTSFENEKDDENYGTSFMTDVQTEIADLKADGHKAKRGPAW
jgi:hypothetical protein